MARPERAIPEPSTVLQTEAAHALIEAAKADEEEAVRTLVAEAMAFLHPAIMAMLHKRRAAGSYVSDTMLTGGSQVHRVIEEDAWDLTHATCVAVLNNLASFKGRNRLGRPVRFSTWIYAIAQNQVRAALRKRWREQRRRQRNEVSAGVDGATQRDIVDDSGATSPEAIAVEQAELDLIRQGLREAPLTDEQREAVIMFVVMGYRQDRIAELTGVQVGTVKKRVFDGLRKLRAFVHEADSEQHRAGGS